MSPHVSSFDLRIVGGIVAFIITWYLYQIVSRKKERLRFKLKELLVSEACYTAVLVILLQQRLPPLEALIFSVLIGLACGYLFVRPPRRDRRIPKAVRQQVIARDLTSKGLKWDPARYHIDHVVPFSRDGDHSVRNLRVIEKRRNLRKGDRMPRLWDFLKR